MGVYQYDKVNDELKLIAGGLLYADAPVGSIQAYGGTTAPSGWLLCQGQAVSRTEYADLFKAIGTAFGGEDGSTTFNVPDLRETVPVGIGENSTATIATHDVYILGEFKDDELRSHTHIYTRSYTGNNNQLWHTDTATTVAAGTSTDNPTNGTGAIKDAVGKGIGVTTHGKQLGVNYIIKAKQTPVPADFMDAVNGVVETAIADELHYNARVNSNVRMFITSSQTLTFTASKTGLLKAYMHKSGSGHTARLFVNGVSVDQLSCFEADSNGTILPWLENGGIDTTLSAFVKEGDVVKIDSDESDSPSTNSWYIYATVLQYKS